MKYLPRTYARAFAEAAASVPKGRESEIINNFLFLIKKSGDLAHIGKIVELAEEAVLKNSGHDKWIVESARLLKASFASGGSLKDVRGLFKNLIKHGDILEEKINSELIAGVRITQNGERQFDGSLRAKIEQLFA